jgi:hypothetical protein
MRALEEGALGMEAAGIPGVSEPGLQDRGHSLPTPGSGLAVGRERHKGRTTPLRMSRKGPVTGPTLRAHGSTEGPGNQVPLAILSMVLSTGSQARVPQTRQGRCSQSVCMGRGGLRAPGDPVCGDSGSSPGL